MAESVTMKGKPLSLQGKQVKEGEVAPDCELVGNDMNPVKLSAYKGKWIVLMSVPSLDTSVCSKETRRFNEEMSHFSDKVNVVCISMDLPFAQGRWCAAENISNVVTLSDYRKREFGEKYGLLISELSLLARAVFLIDPQMVIKRCYLIKEVTDEPNYKVIFDELQTLTSRAVK